MRRALGFIVLLALGHAVAADDASVGGVAELTAPRGAIVDAELFALFANDSTGLASLVLTAPKVTVHRWREDVAWVTAGPTPTLMPVTREPSSYELTDVTIVLTSERSAVGWWGAYPAAGSRVVATLSGAGTLRASEEGHVGNSRVFDEQRVRPDAPTYGRDVPAPHLRASMTGSLVIEDAFALKLCGPSVTLQAYENASTVATGGCTPPETAGGVQARTWLTIEAPVGSRLEVVTETSADLAIGTAAISVSSGHLSYRPVGGEPNAVEGSFTATFTPTPSAGPAGGALRIQGDARPLVGAPPAVSPSIVEVAGWIVAAVVGLAVGALAAWAAVARVGRVDLGKLFDRPAEADLRYAALLASVGRHRAALRALRRALRADPRLVLEVDTEGAFRALAESPAFVRLVASAHERARLA